MSQVNEIQTDLLVIGSGAGALVSAVTAAHHGANVIVVEKSDRYGGTSAMSGGGVWIPNSKNAERMGASDSADEAYLYMKTMIGDEVADQRLRAFIKYAPEMLEFMQNNSHLDYEAFPYPDYYTEKPGAKEGYRTQAPKVFRGRKLGSDLYKIREQAPGSLVQGRFSLTIAEARKFLTQQPGWRLVLFKVLLSYMFDIPGRLKGKLARRMTQGHALIGSLYLSLKDKGGQLWLNAPMTSLIHKDGRVIGAEIKRDGQTVRVIAKHGVVLAAGGFEHNAELRAKSLPQPTTPDWSVSQENNTGDAHIAGMSLDAAVDLMEHAWWIPVVDVPGWPRAQGIFAERSLPGLVMVNKQGKRFSNEALPYLESGYSMYEADSVPSWVIFDSVFRKKYPFGPLAPGWAVPDKMMPKKVRAIVKIADSLDELASKVGIDATGLQETIERNNEFAVTGVDRDFQRGEVYYDRFYGDSSNKPNSCIANIGKPPFYAIPLHPGDIGTKGGLLTDEHARVLNNSNTVIEGLYAIGNTSASVMGSKYLGAGATLGPAMTFGYVAALNALDIKND
ncbi:MAG: 3-oxosteroid 1-dehydrogenase [Parvicella sp.]|jgi:3-oxosteroid 1-dehydrogenase